MRFPGPATTVRLLEDLDVPRCSTISGCCPASPTRDGTRALFSTLITIPPSRSARCSPVLEACVEGPGRAEFTLEYRTTLELGERYPGDPGVLASMLLNRMTLEPGQALYLPAGNLHAYLSGVGVEIMANSDNVLRGGLTPKHADVPELMRVLDFGNADVPVLDGDPSTMPGEWVYPTPAAEFRLSRFDPGRSDVKSPTTARRCW